MKRQYCKKLDTKLSRYNKGKAGALTSNSEEKKEKGIKVIESHTKGTEVYIILEKILL